MEDCKFCQIQENVLWETAHLIVKASETPLVEGEIVVITKDHLSCMAELPEKIYINELETVLKEVQAFFKNSYNRDIVWYEHGIAGQEIKHAQIVCLPISKGVLKVIINDIGNPREIEYFEEWKEFLDKFKRYYVINQYDSLFIFEVERARKNYFRKIIAKKLKIDINKISETVEEKRMEKLIENVAKWRARNRS